MIDRRVRYPEQVSEGLGLPILGTIPQIRRVNATPEEAAQVIDHLPVAGLVHVDPVVEVLARSLQQAGRRVAILSRGYGATRTDARIVADRRDALQAHLKQNGIGTEVYYPLPMHLQPCFATLGHRAGDLPVAEAFAQRSLFLLISGIKPNPASRSFATSLSGQVMRVAFSLDSS